MTATATDSTEQIGAAAETLCDLIYELTGPFEQASTLAVTLAAARQAVRDLEDTIAQAEREIQISAAR